MNLKSWDAENRLRELKADYMVKMIHGFNLVAEKAAAQVSLLAAKLVVWGPDLFPNGLETVTPLWTFQEG